MQFNQEKADGSLYDYLIEHIDTIRGTWPSDSSSGNAADDYTNQKLEEMKKVFAQELVHVFREEESQFYEHFEEKISAIVEENKEMWQPMLTIQEEFTYYRNAILEQIRLFIHQYEEAIPTDHVLDWQRKALQAFDYAGRAFMKEAIYHMNEQMQLKEAMILELSSPVILIQKKTGLLPLIGHIDEQRGQVIVEHTLKQCTESELTRLYIDLSGVRDITTFVAQRIMQLATALKLVGVETTLCGMRPEMAQTAVQLGISFKDIDIVSELTHALRTNYAL